MLEVGEQLEEPGPAWPVQTAIRLNVFMSDIRLDDGALMKMGECSRLRKLWSKVILEQRECTLELR